jgi:hypothetical protein
MRMNRTSQSVYNDEDQLPTDMLPMEVSKTLQVPLDTQLLSQVGRSVSPRLKLVTNLPMHIKSVAVKKLVVVFVIVVENGASTVDLYVRN